MKWLDAKRNAPPVAKAPGRAPSADKTVRLVGAIPPAGSASSPARGVDPIQPLSSAAAAKMAEELGISLEGIQGSGAGGMITVPDVRDAHARSIEQES